MISSPITSVELVSGQRVELPPTGITVITGPNNSGKSTLLRDMRQAACQWPRPAQETRWVRSVEMKRTGGVEEFKHWAKSRARKVPQSVGRSLAGRLAMWNHDMNPGGYQLVEDLADRWSKQRQFDFAHQLFFPLYEAIARGNLLGSEGQWDATSPPVTALQRVSSCREMQEKLSSLVKQAFGFEISINRYAQTIELLMGAPALGDTKPPPSEELLAEYADLPYIREQGDGIRSFCGLLLHVMATDPLVSFIDEPEAFLHPPQARLLGRYFGEETHSDRQLIIATHSSDVLQGVIDAAPSREIQILRLTREVGSSEKLHSVDVAHMKRFWTDPVLRYSRLLEGLFHRGVVLCEADNDCRFYSAVLDESIEKWNRDVVFTSLGGKGRLAKAVGDLKKLGSPVVVIGDIDVLQEKGHVEKMMAEAGGDSTTISKDLQIIRDDVERRLGAPTVSDITRATKPLAQLSGTASVPNEVLATLRAAVKMKSGWEGVKRAGVNSFAGEAYGAVMRVLEALREVGIFIVPVGELERWYPMVDAPHGQPYVTSVLDQHLHKNPPGNLREFMESIVHYFSR
jgi:predicted ATPase